MQLSCGSPAWKGAKTHLQSSSSASLCSLALLACLGRLVRLARLPAAEAPAAHDCSDALLHAAPDEWGCSTVLSAVLPAAKAPAAHDYSSALLHAAPAECVAQPNSWHTLSPGAPLQRHTTPGHAIAGQRAAVVQTIPGAVQAGQRTRRTPAVPGNLGCTADHMLHVLQGNLSCRAHHMLCLCPLSARGRTRTRAHTALMPQQRSVERQGRATLPAVWLCCRSMQALCLLLLLLSTAAGLLVASLTLAVTPAAAGAAAAGEAGTLSGLHTTLWWLSNVWRLVPLNLCLRGKHVMSAASTCTFLPSLSRCA